ncbi:MAG: N-6 DNA methylase [Gallionella sp.]|jgi:type I restriction enzyme M protein|uniref:N-6 DNA methylase n=1 Tax=Metallibacterium sp. TaxID=2940281 RepID=UPI00262FEE82|nr:N-6 DNA methylase [Metallibacterium sp.]MBW8078606.1 N-6 DNA methylase [Gallionella sp.]
MLDTDTKRRIDTARDILVGKVPDPKSQVEQITIALIYKFMDDMDAESEEMGGQRKFFANGSSRFGWARLMRSGLGGHETLNLYAEAIAKMPENPGIPPLFRDIFKNAYLPYRDPETLRAFLKVIDEFSYDHSERLGDAFEYLLSVLGSQGDAGQFRTPRHIIDFMVAVLDPKKTETVLDPACGTAGFLISSWKHILKANSSLPSPAGRGAAGEGSAMASGDLLTPDEKARLARNVKGYDISPDMVRLSLVNLYLHGFTDPHIFEYDTLTSDERWNEHADVILANPPFMSPKGGIKPHKRFSIQAKRSEVLFVDYIAEHLTPNGRAGIIVPEGIIFQSQTAYTQLRKMLVEQYLVAVVSLPAGVFQPYSGVKTSILILDKSLAKHSDSIAFFKVENDGFGLGAQRRAIEKNDLPQVKAELAAYLQALRSGQPLQPSVIGSATAIEPSPTGRGQGEGTQLAHGLIVPKAKIAANGDYNLSGERYREGAAKTHTFPLVKIGDVCTVNPRKSQLNDLQLDTRVSFVPMADLNEHRILFQPSDEKQLSEVSASYTYFEDNDVLLAKVTPCFENGKAGIARGLLNGIGFGSSEFYVLRSNGQVMPEWVYFCVMHPLFRDAAIAQMTGTGGLQRVPRDYVENFQIPLPPLEVQKEIVAEIEGYQKVIDGARAVLDHYRPHIPIHPDWPMVELGELCTIERGASPRPIHDFITDATDGVNWIKIGDAEVGGKYITATKERVTPAGAAKSRRVKPGDFVLSNSMSFGRPYIMATEGCIHDGWLLLRDQSDRLDKDFLYNVLGSSIVFAQFEQAATGGVVNNLNSEIVRGVEIPLPPLATQQAIVAEIEAEQALVAANRELIARFEQKIQATLARIWGEEISPGEAIEGRK